MKAKHLTVSDLMRTAVLTVKERDTLTRADLEMRFAGIRHLPVVDDRYHLVGILSNRDVLRWLAKEKSDQLRVGQVMTRRVRTAHPDTSAREAIEQLIEHKIGCLPVVGEDEQLVGMITETDFLLVAQRALGRGQATGIPA